MDQLNRETIERRVRELGPWFHNLDLAGVKTAPEHFLGDYPQVKWRAFAGSLPADLHGKTVLDIGCNAGFYAIEMKRRGAARVLAIDHDDSYLEQARFAADVNKVEIEIAKVSVYDLGALGERFDIVLCLGVLYHLRHPLLALDLIYEHVARDLLVFQTMQRGSDTVLAVEKDYPFEEQAVFERTGFPLLYFIEHSYSHDPTNWWIPNQACSEALLRSAGFVVIDHPEAEVYICRRNAIATHGAVYPARATEAR
jgi:tRNA (mo5U34)-methyltransferase